VTPPPIAPSKIRRPQLDRLEQAVQEAIYADDRLITHLTNLKNDYDTILGPEKLAPPK
jgi:hypothetical protein